MRIFFSRTIVVHFCSSLCTLAARTSGPPPTGSLPTLKKPSLTSGGASAALTLLFKRSTTGLGVPAGANKPNQTEDSKPGTADSAIVGSSGSTGDRLLV